MDQSIRRTIQIAAELRISDPGCLDSEVVRHLADRRAISREEARADFELACNRGDDNLTFVVGLAQSLMRGEQKMSLRDACASAAITFMRKIEQIRAPKGSPYTAAAGVFMSAHGGKPKADGTGRYGYDDAQCDACTFVNGEGRLVQLAEEPPRADYNPYATKKEWVAEEAMVAASVMELCSYLQGGAGTLGDGAVGVVNRQNTLVSIRSLLESIRFGERTLDPAGVDRHMRKILDQGLPRMSESAALTRARGIVDDIARDLIGDRWDTQLAATVQRHLDVVSGKVLASERAADHARLVREGRSPMATGSETWVAGRPVALPLRRGSR